MGFSKFNCAVACCLAFLWSSAIAQDNRTLRFGIGLNADTPQGLGVARMAELVQQRSHRNLRIELLASGTADNDASMIQALREGRLDLTCPDSSQLTQFVPSFSLINYPFTFTSEQEADALLDNAWGSGLLKYLPAADLVGLAYWENGFRQLTNNRPPISHMADIAGVTLRSMQNAMLIDTFNELGAKAVPMPFNAVYDALASGRVDGQENPLPTIVSSRFYEQQRYLTLSRHVYSAFVVLVSKKTWLSLSAADQDILTAAARDARDYEREVNQQSTASALAELRQHGMAVSSIEPREAEAVRNRLRDVIDHYNHQIGALDVIDMYVALAKIRAEKTSKTVAVNADRSGRTEPVR